MSYDDRNPFSNRQSDYPAPARDNPGPPPASLGSLAQSARSGQLKTAKYILIIVGLLTFISNFILIFFVDNLIASGVEGVANEELAGIKFMTIAFMAFFSLVGILFVVLGCLVYRYPVFCTVTGLVVYTVAALCSGYHGIILKIIIIFFLFRAMQAAFAYQKEIGGAESPANGF